MKTVDIYFFLSHLLIIMSIIPISFVIFPIVGINPTNHDYMSHDFEIITKREGNLFKKTKKHVLHDKFLCFNGLSIRIKNIQTVHLYFELELISNNKAYTLHCFLCRGNIWNISC